jgi:hypothetical protein
MPAIIPVYVAKHFTIDRGCTEDIVQVWIINKQTEREQFYIYYIHTKMVLILRIIVFMD